MIVSWKALKRGAVVAGAVALLSSLMVASVSAQVPTPPDRYFGDVTLDGAPAPAGTNVTATIDGNVCGQTTVEADSSCVRDVVSSGQTTGCGDAGDSIEFSVGGSPAGTATYGGVGEFIEMNLNGAE